MACEMRTQTKRKINYLFITDFMAIFIFQVIISDVIVIYCIPFIDRYQVRKKKEKKKEARSGRDIDKEETRKEIEVKSMPKMKR